MLILPVHHRLDRQNIPWMSLLIALLCIAVFFGPQQGDAAIEERAVALYAQANLAQLERPVYAIYAAANPDALVHKLPEDDAREYADLAMQYDPGFRHALEAGEGFADAAAAEEWTEQSRPYREAIASTVAERFTIKSSTPTMFEALTSTFLHGDWGHLTGNLLFLLMLGLLVERALGPWLFLGLYLLSGIGAGWTWATFAPPGESALGASGAISGLMGAVCVLWGMRRIRFFYWFFVVFDYVRAPAIWLLVPWLGWELLQWGTDEGSRVAYSAHAGGIVAGAALAALIRWRAWDRPEAYTETVAAKDEPVRQLASAQAALGRLAFDEVEAALEPLLAQADAPFEVRVLALRAAVMSRRKDLAAGRARELLTARARADEFDRRLDALTAWRQSGGQWSAPDALAHARLLAARSRCDDAAAVLVEAAERGGVPQNWTGAWLRLGFDRQRDGDAAGASALFTALDKTFPDSPEAAKARAQLHA